VFKQKKGTAKLTLKFTVPEIEYFFICVAEQKTTECFFPETTLRKHES
jgi:hypothetical protein